MNTSFYDQNELNRKVFEHAKRLGLKDWQIAEKLKITPQLITKWRRGKGSPSIDDVIVLSDIFKVTVHELLVNEKALQNSASMQSGINWKVDGYENLQAS